MVRQDGPSDPNPDSLWQAYQGLRSEDEQMQLRGFEQLFALREQQVTQFAWRSLQSHASKHPARRPVLNDVTFHAENVSQEAWVVIYRKIGMFRCPDQSLIDESFTKWMSAIVANVVHEYLRSIQRWVERNDPLEDQDDDLILERLLAGDEQHDLSDDLHRGELVAYLLAAIRQLKPDEQEFVMQRYFYERHYDAIADSMKRSNAALRVLNTRIKQKLRRLIDELLKDKSD